MAREQFAGGWYDFEKLNMTEGVIQEFMKGSRDREFFLRLDDGSEKLVKSPFSLSARVGHRIRFIEHQSIGWIGHRIFETKSYHIDEGRLGLTLKAHDLPPHGNFLPKYSFWAAIILIPLLAVIRDEPTPPTDAFSVSVQAAFIALVIFWLERRAINLQHSIEL